MESGAVKLSLLVEVSMMVRVAGVEPALRERTVLQTAGVPFSLTRMGAETGVTSAVYSPFTPSKLRAS